MRTLTGKIRYRAEPRLFRQPLVVLQVEVTVSERDELGYRAEWVEWQDADVVALSMLHQMKTEDTK